MLNDIKILREYADYICEGLIFIDSDGKIQLFNKKAREIFSIKHIKDSSSQPGSIAKGDIVIVGDSAFGGDDGILISEDLNILGLTNQNSMCGAAIVAISVYDDPTIMPIYKYTRKRGNVLLSIITEMLGKRIVARIDFSKSEISIIVDKEVFSIAYTKASANIVILDGKTGKLKFHLTKDYTSRNVSIKDLLMGKPHIDEENGLKDGDIVGRSILELHEFLPNIKDYYDAAKGKNIGYMEKYVEVKGKPTLCTLIPIYINREKTGALLQIQDLSQIKKLLEEKNEVLYTLEDIENGFNEQSKDIDIFPQIIGKSAQIKIVKDLLHKVSKSNSSVLLLGESGTGKSKMAREIHNASRNADKPLIQVNCASIPETLMESEFFGYEGGSFTGARRDGKIGYFEMANGGTLFLDEIAEIPASMQAKLLQAIQTKSFYRVGGTKKINVNVRIIAATNRDLKNEIKEGRFREDLYYRINVFPIFIPALRERKEDIPLLVKGILPKICEEIGCESMTISEEALEKLTSYNWPGNIRELENILERAVTICERGTILSEHINFNVKMNEVFVMPSIKTLKEEIEDAEKKAILKALHYFNGDKKEAMKALGIHKTCLYKKLTKYSIEIP
ncbi:MAG: sigma 54-interacting transcriptional regulator [Firmicutes bacterium]|nr:sigma 54-interacting transcriptional regulator [Bacillota bacterium]